MRACYVRAGAGWRTIMSSPLKFRGRRPTYAEEDDGAESPRCPRRGQNNDKRGPVLITPELRKKIESCHNLPSPPGVATKIIELANDPEVDIARIADVLALDPAITAKILRIANSPMYARQRKTENLQARRSWSSA